MTVVSFLRILAIVLIAVFLFAQYARRTGMFFPDRFPIGQWDTSTLRVQPEDHTFTASDGVRLHAWLFRASDANAPMLVWYHGNAGNLSDRALMASNFARRGVSVFVFDYRGFGKSEGKPSESKIFLDSIAAYDFVAKLGAQSIVLYGESVGGPYAAHVAKQRKVRCVVIENSFPSLLAIGNALYKPLPLGWTAPFALRTTDWLNDAGVPVLVMHGRRDEVIPYALGVQLYEGLKVPKEMLTSDRAGHCEIPMIDPRYYDTVTRFISRTAAQSQSRTGKSSP
jgi:uncharacterized protein